MHQEMTQNFQMLFTGFYIFRQETSLARREQQEAKASPAGECISYEAMSKLFEEKTQALKEEGTRREAQHAQEMKKLSDLLSQLVQKLDNQKV